MEVVIAESLIEKMCNVVKEKDVISIVTFFTNEENLQLLNYPISPTGFTILQYAAAHRPTMIPILMSLGADPLKKDNSGRDVLQYLIDNQNLNADIGYLLISKGIDPNTKGLLCHETYLQILLNNAADNLIQKYVPLLLKGGEKIELTHKQANHALLALLKSEGTQAMLLAALTLVEAGANPNIVNDKKQNILNVILSTYPEIKNVLLHSHIPESKIADPTMVFKYISASSLRLEIKYQALDYRSRNQYLNFLILLGNEFHSKNPISYLSQLPLEMILHILTFLDFTAMGKTQEEGIALARQVFSETETIKALMQNPGGINVLQQKNKGGLQFSFFKSAVIAEASTKQEELCNSSADTRQNTNPGRGS